MEDSSFVLLITSLIFIGILSIIGIIGFIIYEYHAIEIDNFQKTIDNLSDEQKCMHICGFRFGSYFDRYKFCLEKCDRISEREAKCGENLK